MEPLDHKDGELAAEFAKETLNEAKYLEAVIRVYQNFNIITVTIPNLLSWVAGASAIGILVLKEEQWAIVSGVASAFAALFLGIHQWQGCTKYQEQLAAKLEAFVGLQARFDMMSKRYEEYTKTNFSELEDELVKARAMPPIVIRKVLWFIPKREDFGLGDARK